MEDLTWPQVNAWRLAQQQLVTRAKPDELLDVVARLGGVQAQLMSAAELALWARIDKLTLPDIQRLLWNERTLVKTWAMRGTLHLLSTADYGNFVAARTATTVKRPPSYYTYHKVTSAELDAILQAVPLVLNATPITREQLADKIAERTGNPNLREVLLSGWGALLKPSAHRGELCFGPNQGQSVTFVRPDKWLGKWKSTDPPSALTATVRHFLTTYGPATLEEFARWWGIDASQARKLFKAMTDELTTVKVEGWSAHLLTTTVEDVAAAKPVQTVRILPYFDPYTIAIARHNDALLAPAHKAKVYRTQGWISPVILVDGNLVGIWEHALKRDKVEITMTLWTKPKRAIQDDLAAEAERLGKFLGSEAEVVMKT